MMGVKSRYPRGLDNLAANKGSSTNSREGKPVGGPEGDHSGHHDALAAGVNAVQKTLGLNPQGGRDSVAERIGVVEGELEAGLGELPEDIPSKEELEAKTLQSISAIVNVEDCGAKGEEGSNDLAALQRAHDEGLPAEGGVIYLPRPVDYPVVSSTSAKSGGGGVGLVAWKDNVTIAGPGRLVQFGGGASLQRTVIVAGGGKTDPTDPLNPAHRDINQEVFALAERVASGATSIKLKTASQASHFGWDDDIYIRTGHLVPGAANQVPDAEYNKVREVNASTGVITLQWPTVKPYVQEYYTEESTSSETDATDHGFGAAPFGVSNVTATTVRNFRCLVDVEGLVDSDYSVYLDGATGVVVEGMNIRSFGNGIAGGRSFRNFRFADNSAFRPAGGEPTLNWFAPSTGCSNGKILDNTLVGELPRKMHMHEGIADLEVSGNLIKTKSAASGSAVALLSTKGRAYRHKVHDNEVNGAFSGPEDDIFAANRQAVGCEFKNNRIHTLPGRALVNLSHPEGEWSFEGNTFPEEGQFIDLSTLSRWRSNVNAAYDSPLRAGTRSDRPLAENSTALQDVTGLSFQAQAGSIYFVEASLLLSTPSAESDWKYGWSGPTGFTAAWQREGEEGGVGVSAEPGAALGAGAEQVSGSRKEGVKHILRVAGWIFTDPTHAGTVHFRMAQNTAKAEVPSVCGGSFLAVEKL
jgi:hypothetical protein